MSRYRPRPNPLTGFDRLQRAAETLTPGRVFAAYRPLFLPDAGAIYDKELAIVPFPLRIVVVASPNFLNPDGTVRARERERFVQGLVDQAEEYVLGSGENIALMFISDVRPGAVAQPSRGSPLRTSPFTPFTILHRMWDVTRTGNGPSYGDLVPREVRPVPVGDLGREETNLNTLTWNLAGRIYKDTRGAERSDSDLIQAQLFSAGVDTAAGRMGVLGDANQVLADLFALRSKTGRWGYDPYALPTLNPKYGAVNKWPADLLDARIRFNYTAQAVIDSMIEGLSGGGFVFLLVGA